MKQQELLGKHRIAVDTVINAPAQKVWDVIADFSAVDTWAPQVTKSYRTGSKDSGVGAERHCDIKGFGSIDEVITEWTEGRSLSYRVTPLGPLGVSYNRWTVLEVDDATSEVVTELVYDVRFGLFGALLHKFMMRGKLEEAFPKSLDALKERVETGQLVRPRRAPAGMPQLVSAGANH